MLNRKAIVRSKIENAQGLILSMIADTPTSGSSHVPSLLMLHNVFVPKPVDFKNNTEPTKTAPIIISMMSFLFMIKASPWR